jgi:hypothetical protein
VKDKPLIADEQLPWRLYEFVHDQVYRCTEELIWEALWDDARKISKGAVRDLEDVYGDKEVQLQH